MIREKVKDPERVGYSSDYIVERLFCDARGQTLHFKTSEWLRQDIAKAVTGI